MCCNTRCDGSKFSPSVPSGNSANSRRQTAGLTARFLPPGHSSVENSIGQFSIPIFTPAAFASATIAGQTSRTAGQLSSIDFVQSRPMNVLTTPTPSRGAARITSFRCSTTYWRWAGSGSSGFG